jgi:hypothetical protein
MYKLFIFKENHIFSHQCIDNNSLHLRDSREYSLQTIKLFKIYNLKRRDEVRGFRRFLLHFTVYILHDVYTSCFEFNIF